MLAALRFLIVFEALGLAGVPLARRALGRLPGFGLGFARLLAWLVLAWMVWMAASLGLPNGTGLAAVGAVALVATAVFLHRRGERELDPFARRLWLWSEAIFVVAFVAAVIIGGYAPDVWQTEHPLDMTLVNANLTDTAMPPHDPWYAGKPLNYYYLGQNMVALIIRLTGGMEPTKGYNLALAAIFALLISTSFTVAATIAEAARRRGLAIRHPLAAGAWCVVLLCFMGNLRAGWYGWHASPLRGFDWFGPTRIIPHAINEFPFASWTVGDLHAHFIAAPLVLLALAFAVQVALRGPPRLLSWETFAAALVTGWLYGAHSWSFPVAAGLLLAGALVYHRRALLWAAGTVALGLVLVLPFILTVKANTKGVGLTTTKMREPLGPFLSHHLLTDGTFLWLLLAPVAGLLVRARHRLRWLVWGAAACAIVLPLLAGAHLAGAALLAGLVAVTFGAALTRPESERVIWLIAAGGFGCLLAAEVGLVKDEFFDTPYVRLNTIFKFAYHAWLLLAVFGAVALSAARAWLPRRVPRIAWLAVAFGLIGVGCGYVVPATYTRKGAFADGPHLEGRTWLARMSPGDVRAIDWIRAHTDQDAVVVEAVGDEYSPYGYGRISTYTGRPTIMGWEFHESEYNHPPGTRRADVKTLYSSPDPATVAAIVARYKARYVVVGPLELTSYGQLGALATVGHVVFSAQGTKVYALR